MSVTQTFKDIVFVVDGCSSDVYAKQNPLTHDWLVVGQDGGGAYFTPTRAVASQMIQTTDHWNKTREVKAFPPAPMQERVRHR
jgi:hypothetical protein